MPMSPIHKMLLICRHSDATNLNRESGPLHRMPVEEGGGIVHQVLKFFSPQSDVVSWESEPSPGMPESDLCDDDDDVHRLPAPPQVDRSWESGRLPRMLDADMRLLAKLMTRFSPDCNDAAIFRESGPFPRMPDDDGSAPTCHADGSASQACNVVTFVDR